MKAQCEKIESRADNVIKLSVVVQPEICPNDIMKWRFQNVEIQLSDEDMVTIPKAEYEALRAGGSWVIPEEKRQALKNVVTMLLDWVEGD